MFAGGARWLLLLLPQPILQLISNQITLIGSASVTAPDLLRAMLSNWKIDGNGPIPFPFAFHSGIFQSYVMNGYTGISGMAFIIVLLLLLTAQRWRNPFAGVITFILISSLALANEVTFGSDRAWLCVRGDRLDDLASFLEITGELDCAGSLSWCRSVWRR